jgi:hypothetical protein
MLKIKNTNLFKVNLISITGVCLVFILIVFPVFSFFNQGPYLTFLANSNVYQGFIELLILGLFFYFTISAHFPKLKTYIQFITILVFVLSLRRHNVDIPILIIALYFNSFFFIGSYIKKNEFPISFQIPLSIAIGMIFFALICLFLSLFNLAKDFILVSILSLISFISFFLKGRNLFSGFKLLYNSSVIKNHPFFSSLIVLVFLMLIFQTNNYPGYDEFWYTLRSHELLNRDGSFFEKIVYPDNWVAYYPKFTEILIYPLQLFPNYGMSKLFNVATWGLISFVIFSYLTSVKQIKKTFVFTLVIMVIPCFSNMAIFTKGDVLALFFFLIAFLFMLKSIENLRFSDFLFAIVISLVAVTARLSAMPYTFIFIFFFMFYFVTKVRKNKLNYIIERSEWFFLVSSVLLVFLLFFRTYYLVGVPFVQIPFSRSINGFLGFSYNFYLQPLQVDMGCKIGFFEVLFSSLFQPMKLKSSIAWYSNFYFLLMILTLYFFFIFRKREKIKIEYIFSFILIGAFWILTGVFLANEFYIGGDGNYFLIPVVISSMVFAGFLVKQPVDEVIIKTIFVSYFPLHLILTLITGPNWDPGTDKFHLNMIQNPFSGQSNKLRYRNEAISKMGIQDMITHLPDEKNIYLGGIGRDILGFKLGCSYINLRNVELSRGYLVADYQTFLNLLKSSGINFLLFPNETIAHLKLLTYFEMIKNENGVVEFKGADFSLLDLRMFLEEK